jgi:GntR family transcriptional regulator/MocR family aminotransferase
MLEQLAFTEFLQSGSYDRHVRKMRLRYRHRRDLLVHELVANVPEFRLGGTAAGLNLLVHLPDAETEHAAVEAANARGIGIYGVLGGGYYEGDGGAGLIVGYAATPECSFSSAVEALVAALDAVR